jgi:hypothetical protein
VSPSATHVTKGQGTTEKVKRLTRF